MVTQSIFAADDWGMSPAINEGILELGRRGWLNSVSMMANAPHLELRLDDLVKLRPLPRFSLHLNFTYGRAASDPAKVSGLINPHGQFYDFKEFWSRALFGKAGTTEIIHEAKTQLQKLRMLGLEIEDLDGHHHIHLHPKFARALHRSLGEQGIRRVRLLKDPDHKPSYIQTVFFETCIKKDEPRIAYVHHDYLVLKNLRSKDEFRKKLKESASRRRSLICHPATADDFDQWGVDDALRSGRSSELGRIIDYM